MSREDERELNRNVKESGQSYVNALVAYHRAVKAAEAAQYKLAIERRCVEDAHERNEVWLGRRAKHTPKVGTIDTDTMHDLDTHGTQSQEAVEQ